MIIDIHTHVPPRESWERFLCECRDNDIAIAATSSLGVSGWPHEPDPETVRLANEDAKAFADYAGGMVLWFAYINPQNENWREELQGCLARGARGVKLWVSLKDPETGSLQHTREVLQRLRGTGIPVLIHTFHRTDDNLPGEVTVAEFADLAREVPDVPLIAGHAGCNWRQALGLLEGIENAFVDVCGGFPEPGMTEALVQDIGAEKVLYGSDGLGRSFPSQIAKVRFARLTDNQRQDVLWRNAAGLLGISDEEMRRAAAKMRTLPQSGRIPLPDMGVDHFCYLGCPPFRDTPAGSAAELDALLAARDIRKAYAADAGSLYAADIREANRSFARTASGTSRIVPLATLLPCVPNWRPTLQEARQQFAGAILFPYLHNWQLDLPACRDFFLACADLHLPLWINVCTADYRFRHRGLACRPVSRSELLHFLETAPKNQYVFQGLSAPDIKACLAQASQRADVRCEISRLTDTTSALPDMIAEFGCSHLVFGSEFPFRDLRTVSWTARRLCGWDTANCQ